MRVADPCQAAQLENKELALERERDLVHGSENRCTAKNGSWISKAWLQEYHARMKFLSEVPLMKRLPKDEHPIVAEACEAPRFASVMHISAIRFTAAQRC